MDTPAFVVAAALAAPALAQPQWAQPPGGGPDGPVYVIAEYSGNPVIGGAFTSVNGQAARNVARYLAGQWQPLGDGLVADFDAITTYNYNEAYFAYTSALYQDGGDLFMGGNFFDTVNGRAGIARFNGSDWFPLGTGLDSGSSSNGTYAITKHLGDLVVAGNFRRAGPHSVTDIARWNDGSWSTYGTGAESQGGSVYDTLVFDGDLVIAGTFDAVSGTPAESVARWNGVAWTAMGSGLPGTVRDLEIHNGDLYACGDVTLPGGLSNRGIARWNPAAAEWETIDNNGGGLLNNPNSPALVMASHRGNLYIGGYMSGFDGTPFTNLGVWNGTAWSAPVPSKQPTSDVLALYSDGDRLWVGGDFTTIGSDAYPSLALLEPPCPADVNHDGVLDNGDIGAFVTLFLAGELAADFTNDGILDNGDIGAFVAAFLAGC